MKYQNKRSWKYRVYKYSEFTLYSNYGNVAHKYFQIVGNHMFVKAGYLWDGPSGPTVDSENFMSPSLIHDVLFQCMREGLLSRDHFKLANKELYYQCRERGMSRFRASYVKKAVDWFGKSNIKSDIIEVD
ncbi:MAG: hypothetical protein GY750_20940 [Lentisphaerae bacterium]|nr:hypothetical protein [Lentisphaerota bacterium]